MQKNKRIRNVLFVFCSVILTLSFCSGIFGLFANLLTNSLLSVSPQIENNQGIVSQGNIEDILYENDSKNNSKNIVDYVTENSLQAVSLPNKFSLYDTPMLHGELAPNVGDQHGAGICWAFASNTALESTLYRSNIVDKGVKLNFSEADLAYNIYAEKRDLSSVGGGSFDIAYEYFSTERGPVMEQSWETNAGYGQGVLWDSDAVLTSTYRQNLEKRNYTPVNAGYSALEAVNFPSRSAIQNNGRINGKSELLIQNEVETFRQSIKNHIYTHGAVTSSIKYEPNAGNKSTGFYYKSSKMGPANHLVTLVGWDDDKEFTIMNNQTVKGAYIVQNSHGVQDWKKGYFYIPYDDAYVEDCISGFLRVSKILENANTYNKTQESNEDNEFFMINSPTTYSFIPYQTDKTLYLSNFFMNDKSVDQYISRIKVPTVSYLSGKNDNGLYYNNRKSTNFKLYVIPNITYSEFNNPETTLAHKFRNAIPITNKNNNSSTQFTSNQFGFYTVELDQTINLSSGYFAVIMVIESGGNVFLMDNNSNKAISSGTYQSSQPSSASSWGMFGFQNRDNNAFYETVLPMMVQTKYSGEIQYEARDKEVVYDGLYQIPDIKIISPADCIIMYSLDGGQWTTSIPKIKDVKFIGNNVEPYVLSIKISAEYYADVNFVIKLTILQKDLLVIPNEKEKIYGQNDLALTQTFEGFVGDEYPFYVGRLKRTPGENVGNYDIVQDNLELKSRGKFIATNYRLKFDKKLGEGKFKILPQTLTINPTTLTSIYGESEPEILQFSLNGLVGKEMPIYDIVLQREAGSDVGKYKITIKSQSILDNNNTGFLLSNYTIFFADDNFYEIKKRDLIVTADSNLYKTYGEQDILFTYTYKNNVSGEIPTFKGNLQRAEGEDVGFYQITKGSLDILDNPSTNFKKNNYQLVFAKEPVYFEITNGEISSALLVDTIVEYDGSDKVIIAKYDVDTRVRYCEGNVFNPINATINPITKINAGKYIITVEFKKDNYSPRYETKTLTIKEKSLTIVPKSGQSKVYGDEDFIEYTYYGNVEGEIPIFQNSITRCNVSENVGTYTMELGSLKIVNNQNFLAKNYKLIFSDLDENSEQILFEIKKRDLLLYPTSNQNKVYGQDDPRLLYEYKNVAFKDNPIFVGSLSRTEGENVGMYQIIQNTLSLDSSVTNYNLVFTENPVYFNITPALLTIGIDNKEIYYASPDLNAYSDFSYKIISGQLFGNDELILEYKCYDNEGRVVVINEETLRQEDGYEITAINSNKNYNVTVQSGKFFIKYKFYTITLKVLDNTFTSDVEHFSFLEKLPDELTTNITGYDFKGIWKNTDGKEFTNILAQQVVGDETYIAEMTPIEYNITYVLNGGSFDLSEINKPRPAKKYTIVDSVTLVIPYKEGHIFGGWFTDELFKTENRIKVVEKGSYGNKTFYAEFTPIVYEIKLPSTSDKLPLYEIINKNNNDSLNNASYGEDFIFTIKLKDYTYKSYDKMAVSYRKDSDSNQVILTKTSVEEDGSYEYVIPKMDANVEIFVDNVTINNYNINFIIDGEVKKQEIVTHGGILKAAFFPELHEKEHYDNVEPKWDTQPDFEVYDDMDITAIYTPNIYNVTFVMPDGEKFDVQVTYGEKVSSQVLEDNYDLSLFEHFEYSQSLYGVDRDSTIEVTIIDNIYILYICLGVLAFALVVISAIAIIMHHRRHKFNWWVYKKDGDK